MKCKDKPSATLPIEGDCVSCGGSGCADCGHTGRFQVTHCPAEWIDEDIFKMIGLAELYEKGLAPVAGGVLDQAAFFVHFAQRVWNEAAQYKRPEGVI